MKHTCRKKSISISNPKQAECSGLYSFVNITYYNNLSILTQFLGFILPLLWLTTHVHVKVMYINFKEQIILKYYYVLVFSKCFTSKIYWEECRFQKFASNLIIHNSMSHQIRNHVTIQFLQNCAVFYRIDSAMMLILLLL